VEHLAVGTGYVFQRNADEGTVPLVVVALPQAAAEGSPLAAQAQSEFADVPSSHPYYVAISTLAEFEIVGGYVNGYTFSGSVSARFAYAP
jgi:hypothetical protein